MMLKIYVMNYLLKNTQKISSQSKSWTNSSFFTLKLTIRIENTNISSTSNKIENIFQKVFPKHIKRTMKIELGLLSRFILKLNHWNIKNEKEKNHTSF